MSNISLFNRLPSKGLPHTCDEQLSITDFLNAVKYGRWQNFIEPIRIEADKKKRDMLKRNIPSVTISGLFDARSESDLLQHSGFICIDIDHYTDKAPLLSDPYTYALMKSASGGGLAVVIKVNPEKHKESFKWIQNYYYITYGIRVDPAPQNVASLRFVSYDPELTINDKSKLAKTITAKPKQIKSLPVVLTGDKVEILINEVCSRGINLAPDYDSYLRLSFALASGFGENGRLWFHNLCSQSEKYDSRHAEKQYDSALKGNKSGITVGTFYWMLKDNGIQISNDSQKLVQLASIGKKSGRTQEGIAEQLVQIEGVDPHQATELVKEVFNRNDITVSSAIGDPSQLIESLYEWIAQNHPIRKNAITRILEENGSEIKEEMLNTIYLRARIFMNSEKVTQHLVNSIIFSTFTHEFNPVTEYIERNHHRKSSENITALAKSIRSNTEMKEVFIRKWMISLIAAYNGNPVRSVLSLVGGQNSGKTEWFRRLLPNGLKKYYAESKLDAGKDDDILMCQKLIIMDDEMGGKSKQDEKRFKELTSKSIFSLRAPYAKANEDFKRLAVLCGTSNEAQIINDPTGNTRILPIEVLSIDHELYNSIDKDELFMEAFRAYESGEEWQLNQEELRQLDKVGGEFTTVNYEKELISKFFGVVTNPNQFSEWLTTTEIKDLIEMNTKQKITNIRKLGMELTKIFGKSTMKKVQGSNLYRYNVVRFQTQEPEIQAIPF